MTTGEWPTVRHAARVVLLDETRRVLLARFEYGGRVWWAAPGGGLERAETHEEAARREVKEEMGLKKSPCNARTSVVDARRA
jgi:8-oxo-dGTP pyrophosphatase MutT (NUDIX family)